MKKLLSLLAVLILTGCNSVEDWIHNDVDEAFVAKEFTAQQLHQDLNYLVHTMQARHPAYEQYVESDALDKK